LGYTKGRRKKFNERGIPRMEKGNNTNPAGNGIAKWYKQRPKMLIREALGKTKEKKVGTSGAVEQTRLATNKGSARQSYDTKSWAEEQN